MLKLKVKTHKKIVKCDINKLHKTNTNELLCGLVYLSRLYLLNDEEMTLKKLFKEIERLV